MFRGENIGELVQLFSKRGVSLYHSAQFVDYQSYIGLGGIPSRSLLQERELHFTAFESDQIDKENQVWDKVFLNPLDFGVIFARGSNGVPTVYGPIAFVFRPQALLSADDVAICLRSAGVPGFNREKEALKTVEDVDNIFCYEKNHSDIALRKWIKSTSDLCREFNLSYASNPEISINIGGNCLSFMHLRYVLVDPYRIRGKYLFEIVQKWSESVGFKVQIRKRSYPYAQFKIAETISNMLETGIPSLESISKNETMGSNIREWAGRLLQRPGMVNQWSRYATYFRNGTLLPVLAIEGHQV